MSAIAYATGRAAIHSAAKRNDGVSTNARRRFRARSASIATTAGKPIDALRQWAVAVQKRSNHNKATCALANKLARICYATLRDQEPYGAARLNRKLERVAFAMPA